jgi:hypothetical protein
VIEDPTPAQAAFVAFADHCIACATCRAMDAEGVNLNLPCATADKLNQAFKEARQAVSV